jgi:hypothetical protein
LFTFSNCLNLNNIIINNSFFLFFFKKNNINSSNIKHIDLNYVIKEFLYDFKITINDIFLNSNSKIYFKNLKLENLLYFLFKNYFNLFENLNKLDISNYNIQILYEKILLNNFNFYFNILDLKNKKITFNLLNLDFNLSLIDHFVYNIFNNCIFSDNFNINIKDNDINFNNSLLEKKL